jgi:hypothetical protein
MRYTLDVSTQFLLGNSVHSLDGGLAYPHIISSPSSSAQLDKDPATAFGVALSEGTYLSADRSKYGAHWPLAEFWKDEVKARRDVIDAFIEPHLKRVLSNVEEKRASGSVDQADVEDQTLVECLARQTPDGTLIKDEVRLAQIHPTSRQLMPTLRAMNIARELPNRGTRHHRCDDHLLCLHAKSISRHCRARARRGPLETQRG